MKRTAILTVCALIAGTQVAQAQGSRTVTGRVFDDTTGCPLAGVQVMVLGGKSAHAMTNAEGRYKLAQAPDMPFSLQAMREGYRPKRTDSVTVTDSSARVDFSLVRSGASAKMNYPAAKCHLEPSGDTQPGKPAALR